MSRFRVSTRIYAIVATAVALSAVLALTLLERGRDRTYAMREVHIGDVVDTAVSVARSFHQKAQAGEMSEEAAKAAALTVLTAMRFDGEKNYFFIFDLNGVVLAHGRSPDQVGKNRINATDPNGVRTYGAFVDAIKANGQGTVYYSTNRKGATEPIPKMSVVKGYAPWGWGFGAGAYLDDVDATIAQDRNITLVILAIALVVLGGVSWFIAEGVTGPLAALNRRMTNLAEGDLDTEIPGLRGRDELGAMARAVSVFQENGKRMKQMDDEKAEAEAHAEEQRLDMMRRLGEAFGAVAGAAAQGDFSSRVDNRFDEPSLDRLAEDMNTLMASVETGVKATSQALGGLAEGDLSSRMNGRFAGAFAELQDDANRLGERLSEMVGRIQSESAVIGERSTTVQEGATSLQQRTETQAGSLEETAATMEEMSASISTNAENAKKARSAASESDARAQEGGRIVAEAVDAMGEIEDSSSRITEIVSVIDSIAFQTNLLALNAAVEAARAGDAGKGFAVVASEVRTLAQRSADAARDIKGLIEQSGQKVTEGVGAVRRSGEALEKIIGSIAEVSELVDQITMASQEQASGVSEITSAVNHLDSMTQENAALSDRSASEANGIAEATRRLIELAGFFRVEAAQARRAA